MNPRPDEETRHVKEPIPEPAPGKEPSPDWTLARRLLVSCSEARVWIALPRSL